MQTLRGRLILSHVLPFLLIVPLTGLALLYALESAVLLPNTAADLQTQAQLVATLVRPVPTLWADPARARAFVAQLGPILTARLMLLTPGGQLLVSSDPADASRQGQVLALPGLAVAAAGQIESHVAYSSQLSAEVADVLVPVVVDGMVRGIIRLTHRLASIYERVLVLRDLIAGILAGALLLGAGVGWGLAVYLARPLAAATRAATALAAGRQTVPVPAQGPREMQQLIGAVNTLAAQLAAAERLRRQLLAGIVHELGRPLGAVYTAVQTLLVGADADAALRRDLLTGIRVQLQGLNRLVDELAQVQEQAAAPVLLARQVTAVGPWLASVLPPWREAAQVKGLHWHTAIPADLPRVALDPDRLAQAVGNLLSNAVKYTPPDGTVTIQAGREAGQVWLAVCDTGPGIEPAEQGRIFEPFYRGGHPRFAEGMGLGLQTVA